MDLIGSAHRLAVGIEARVPAARLLIHPLRWLFHLTDSALAALLFLAWVLGFGIFARMARTLRGRGKPATGAVWFLSQEGFTVAPARIRTYYFAERVARMGIPTKTLAFWDDLYRFEHLPDRIVLSIERVVVALRAAHRMLADPPAVIVQQRPNYDLVTTWAVRWVLGTPVVFDIDDWIGDYLWFYPVRVRSVLPRCRALASACVVSSRRLEEDLSPMFPQVVRIPTYADTEAFRPRPAGARSEEVVFGWNGTLFQKFMYDALLLMLRAFRRASAQLGDSNPSVFEIAGTGSYLAEIRKSLAAEFAGCRVRIRGWIDPRAMAQYLDGIDVGLYSLAMVAEGPNSEDGRFIVCKSPTKVFEYMAKGIPTISTRVGEVAHFLEHGVTGFVSDDEDELVEAFVALATDPGLRDRMGAAARRACVERYSMATATAMLADVLAEVGDVAVRGDAKPSLTGLN